MSREIKFRVWDLDNKEWYHSTQLVIRPYSGSITDGATTPNTELMQFTGLNDKNGKEIYEGDILGADETCRSSSHYIVEWNEKHCCFTSIEGGLNNYPGDIDEAIEYSLLSNMRLNVCEVIGTNGESKFYYVDDIMDLYATYRRKFKK